MNTFTKMVKDGLSSYTKEKYSDKQVMTKIGERPAGSLVFLLFLSNSLRH